MAWIADNPLQDWLERTWFGVKRGHQFTLQQEEDKYHKAIKAMS